MEHQSIIAVITNSYSRLSIFVTLFGSMLIMLVSQHAVYAQTNDALNPAQDTLNSILSLVSTSTVIITAAIFLFFFYNVYKYMRDENKEEAKNNLLWSVVGIAIFSTLWGGVAFLRSVTGIEDVDNVGNQNVDIPSIDFNQPTAP
ncbi:MAG: hypothetical protein OYG31_00410 [Candidatus Kaiserbacteria bacterium]|nr:hypothetical protein [Candidatus Kaiserbacteria bacterium]